MPADKPAKRDIRKFGRKFGPKPGSKSASGPGSKSGSGPGSKFGPKPGGSKSGPKPGAKFGSKPGSKLRHKLGPKPGPKSVDKAEPRSGAKPPRKPEGRPFKIAKAGRPRRLPPRAKAAAAGPDEPLRIAKAMARAGLCSRREAERWIEQGRVNVNGKVLTTPAFEVGPRDRVLVDGAPLPTAEPPQLWRYYKPRGLVTTHADPQGRPTVFESLPEDMPRVISVGRLDFNSEGLLLLTNAGAVARYMELPTTGWMRRYRVRVHGRVPQEQLDALQKGVEIEGVRYGPVEATVDSVQGANAWLTFGLREGKNREVRRILAHLGVEVNRLIRISYGPFQLLDMKPGEVEPVKRRVLADQMGPRLAEELDLTNTVEEEQRWKRKGSGGKRGQAE
jgi:23S rRNA pseudouridine2605 synthase